MAGLMMCRTAGWKEERPEGRGRSKGMMGEDGVAQQAGSRARGGIRRPRRGARYRVGQGEEHEIGGTVAV